MYFDIKFKTFLNEGLFSKKSKLEKIDVLVAKLNSKFDDMVDEAGSEDNLSKGAKMGYDNFGTFVSLAYDILIKTKEYLQANTIDRTQFVKIVRTLDDLKDKTDKVNNIRGVSSINVKEFKYVKRNLEYLLKMLADAS